jgi:hypothetical protein
MAGLIYVLCAATTAACAWLLLRRYADNRVRLLLWGGLCFVGLALNNVLVVLDLLLVPQIDFSFWRTLTALVGMAILMYGLIWDAQ